MNQFYRALQMPPRRLLRKLLGEKEVYTIAVRPRPTAEGTEPLPALDGGRMLFLVIEGLRGKPFNREREGLVNLIGFALLIMLAIFITYKDIVALVH